MKKYELTTETLQFAGRTLHRIKAVKDFDFIQAGEFGGWIEKEENLSQDDNAWIYYNAMVFGNANVFGNAKVYGYAKVYDYAKVYGYAKVFGNANVSDYAEVYGNANVFGYAKVSDYAKVYGNAAIKGDAKVHDATDYIVFKNLWSRGRYSTWTRCNNKVVVGCFYGTDEELINKAYNDSEKSGREYERVVRYVQSILADEKREKGN